jgi:DNA-binding transcriptional LysR family regulator
MRLRHIEIFNAVLTAGSISGAARLLSLTQPAVSRTLQHAELQLGLALFHRSKGRLVPTAEAQALRPHIEQLFQQLDEVQRLATNLKAGHAGQELRLLTVLTLSQRVIPRAVLRLRERVPGARVRVMAVHSSQLVSGLALQEADLGLVLSPLIHPALTAEPVSQGELVCVARHGALPARLRRRHHLSLEDLRDLPVVALDANDPLGRDLNQACREAGVQLSSDVTVQTYHAALAFAEHGLGVAVIDSFTALSADPDQVSVLPLRPTLPVTLQALRPNGKTPPPLARQFLGCVREVLATEA